MRSCVVWIVLASFGAACTGSSGPPVRAKTLYAREQALAPRNIVSTPPPPARSEPPRPPGPGGSAIWRGGYYQFQAGRYSWIPGAWVVPPRSDVIWVPGFFQETPDGGMFINGHWRKS